MFLSNTLIVNSVWGFQNASCLTKNILLNTICENSYIPMYYDSGFLFTFASGIRFLQRDGHFYMNKITHLYEQDYQ